jgi:hypothetical protein
MSAWTCSLGWFRFTVSDSTADEVIARVGGDWIKDNKGFLGYRQAGCPVECRRVRPDRHSGELGSS